MRKQATALGTESLREALLTLPHTRTVLRNSEVSGYNQGSIALAKNPEFHKRTKHIDIRYHFVREKVEDGQVVLEYCPTQEMLADIMTKPIPSAQFDYLRTKLSIQVTIESSGSVVKTPRSATV
ncbi:hypothetical protein FI667_g8977, partial [Globisporangium splendens]